MKRKIIFKIAIVLFAVAPLSTYCQKSYSPGYIVLSNNDTVRGYIQDHKSFAKRNSINFRKEISSSEQTSYDIVDIHSICYTDTKEFYYSYKVDIDKKPIETRLLETHPDKKIVAEIVLMKLLVKGNADLFTYSDENYKTHFFFRKEGKIIELARLKFLSKYGQATEVKEYQNQLRVLFSDCETPKESIESLTEIALIKAFKNYNSCRNSLSYVIERGKNRAVVSAWAGISVSSLAYWGSDLNTSSLVRASDQHFNYASNVTAGLSLNFINERKKKPLTFGISASYKKAGSFTSSNNVTDNSTERDDYFLDFSYLNLRPEVKYMFLRNSKLAPYFRIGLGYTLLLTSEATVKTTIYGSSKTIDLVVLSNSGVNIASIIGCSINSMILEFRYEFVQLSSNHQSATTLFLKSPEFAIGYRFH